MAKTRKKARTPKRIAGVKVPKALRRGLKELTATENGKAVLAETLATLAAALAAARAEAGQAADGAAEATAGGARDLSVALDHAKRSFLEALQTARAAPEPAPTPH